MHHIPLDKILPWFLCNLCTSTLDYMNFDVNTWGITGALPWMVIVVQRKIWDLGRLAKAGNLANQFFGPISIELQSGLPNVVQYLCTSYVCECNIPS